MNKIYTIGLFLMILLAIGVSAADLTVSTTSLSAEGRPTESFSQSFSVKNATAALTGLTLSQSGLDDFNINFTVNNVPGNSFNLNTGEQKTISVKGTVPDDIDTGASPFSGTIIISGASIPSKTINLAINAESQLQLDNVKFLVDGKSKSIGDGDTRKDVSPGSKLEIKGDIENAFTDNDDIAIEDVTIEITIDGVDDGDDLEGDEDVGDIDADDSEGFKIEFEIPDDVDADEYNVKIVVEADDENGAEHYVEWDDVKIKVEKDKHDIWITKATVSPVKIGCSREINVDVELKNQGDSDEDEVVLTIESLDLEIAEEDTSIEELEEGTGDDTEYDKTYTFKIDDKLKAGTYPIVIKAYYDTDTLSNSKTIDLKVEKCTVEDEEETEEDVVVVTPPSEEEEEEGPEILTSSVTETTEVSLLQSNTYLMFLIGAVGIAVVVVVVMIVILFSMKKKREI
jgi:uncharacterized membrane protein